MTETERLLQRQAEWQRARRSMSWPEKIRQVERVRSTLEAFQAQRRQQAAVDAAPIDEKTPKCSTRSSKA